MTDKTVTIEELKQRVQAFIAERDWHQFHAPKNIAMSIAIEAAELMEHFQWLTLAESAAVKDDPALMSEIRDELADVTCYILDMASALDIDLADAVRSKLKANAVKYPVEQCRGSAAKYSKLKAASRKVKESKSPKVKKRKKYGKQRKNKDV